MRPYRDGSGVSVLADDSAAVKSNCSVVAASFACVAAATALEPCYEKKVAVSP